MARSGQGGRTEGDVLSSEIKPLFTMILLRAFLIFCGICAAESCMAGDRDLSPIQNGNTWNVKVNLSQSTMSTFYMNLCDTRSSNCDPSSICLKTGDTITNVGKPNTTLIATPNEGGDGFRMDYRGDECTVGATNPKEQWQTTIDFKCDKTLGSPVFIQQSGCTYFFEWHSTVACKNPPSVEEVRCSFYDNDGKKRDLTPLVKPRGGYKVDSESDSEELYINVCREITPDGPTANCKPGSSACRIRTTTGADSSVNREAEDLGQPFKPLQNLGLDRQQLHYNASSMPSGCSNLPQVTIVFVCPREGGRNQGSQNPKLISSTNCNYEVEWLTEYVCPVDMLTTSGCSFTKANHGIDINLTPLQKKSNVAYRVETTKYKFFLDVCRDTTLECPGENNKGAVCQESVETAGNRVIAGVNANHILSYADGELTLTYRGGAVCKHNGFPRTSVVSFECNKTAGVGSPTFVTETECSYFFEWKTQYACLDHAVGKSCRVDFGGRHYDLSPLVREVGTNWQALDGQHVHSETSDREYFINICSEILPDAQHDLGDCVGKAAACFIDNGNVKSLGKYTQSPSFTNGHLTLTYTNGSNCDGKAKTIVTFICAYGDLESAPSFVRKSNDDCLFEFEWRTAAACPLGHKWGTGCRVFDDDAGFSFDLSRLTSTKYDMPAGDYTYSINVCAPLSGTACNEGGVQDVAACQVKNQSPTNDKWSLGKVNTSLEYFDGIIKLTYLNGDLYNTPAGAEPIKRRTEIAFLCAPDQDPGKPEFISEASNAYLFNWNTKYACPEEPIECVVTDETTHEQYDLSSLSKALEEDNWSFVDDSDAQGNRKKYYMNVCRPINPVKGCGAFAGACEMVFQNGKEVESVKSMGVPKSKPIIESPGHLLLTYENGSACSGGKVQSRIHFSCRKGALGSSPRLLEKVSDCVYSFIWETEAACAISRSDSSSGQDCSVKDPNSGYVFNMETLIKPSGSFYSIAGPSGSTFQLNICGNVTGTGSHCIHNAHACLVKSDNSVEDIGSKSEGLKFSDDGLLKLTYTGAETESGNKLKTEITFLCRRNASLSTQPPSFLRKESTTYVFNFETPLACLPESVDCLVSDEKGNQYDLTPLAKESGNWEAVDTRQGMSVSYFINVCRPVNAVGTATQLCPGGPIGACQTTPDSKAFNLGYVQAMPEASDDGSLSVRYVNGDLCHKKYHRSTRINFECSSTPGSPVFQQETESCEYVFAWETPAACPLKRVTGADCVVKIPNYEYEYNLMPLYNRTNDYVVKTAEYNYRINVCGSLIGGKEECADGHVGACQIKTGSVGFNKNAGVFNQKLQYDDGALKLNYSSGIKNCHSDTYERSTAITFFCDEGIEGTGKPSFINEDSDCTYIFEWATPLACPPFKVVECSCSNDQQQFDLAPLARIDDNYRIDPMATVGDSVYYINICRSLLHKKGAQGSRCPYNAAACLSTGNSFTSLGEVSSGPTMENGHLVLRYESGDPCPSGDGKKRSSVISLECDKEGVGSTPQFSYSSNDCEYHFIWLTNLACTINEEKEEVTDDCTAINPATGYKFDLNVLQSSKGYTVQSDKGHQYVFSLCAALESSGCAGANVGSCQTETGTTDPRSFNAGNFNRNLHYHDGTLFLNYEGGAPCHNNAFTRSTIINFVCSHVKGAIGEPVFVDESEDCTYYISWHTALVCENFIQCSVVNGSQVIDLSPLVSDRGYYLANSDRSDQQYYINFCRPLNPIPGVRCPPGSAACLDSAHNQMSLGRLVDGPKISAEGRVSITYINGSQCKADKSRNISTVITLFCERGTSQGTPTLDNDNDCVYHFSWPTNAVCPPSKSSKSKDCKYFDDRLQYEYDLSSLATTEVQVNGPDSRNYNIHLCGSVSNSDSACANSAVCMTNDGRSSSLGLLDKQLFFIEGHILKARYTDDSQCQQSYSKKRQTTIIFKCSETVVPNQPTFFSSDYNCNYVFQWETPLACPPMSMPCNLPYSEKAYDLQPLSQITGSWKFGDDNGNTFYLNLCQPALNTPDSCPKEASICRQKADGTVDTLGMIYTQLLNADGDTNKPIIHVMFREGSNGACGPGSSAQAESEILLTCSNLLGSPRLKSAPGANEAECKFTFVWESKVACSEERVAVELKDGKVSDPETLTTFDLSPVIKWGRWEAKGDERIEKAGRQSVYKYIINLDKTGKAVEGDTNGVCTTAAVCQSKLGDPFFRNIGEITQVKYFMKDEVLEMVFTNPSSCGRDKTEDVETTIKFICNPTANLGQPVFNYESSNCQYYFMWETTLLCRTTTPTEPTDSGGGKDTDEGGNSGPAGSTKSKIPIVLAVLMGVVIVCVLVIIFHKSERRSAFYYRLRSYFPGAYNKVPTYSYSQLANGDVEDSLLGQSNSRSVYSDDEDEELLKDATPSQSSHLEYHDDSDEDILPTV